ncbi:MAG: hypothetical protein U1D69_06730 [Polynucleobacter sp.]|nr:hypothetical protein [Polynucleobacter sp.]
MRTLVVLLVLTSLLSACGGGGGSGDGTSISVDKSAIEFVMDRGGEPPAMQIVTANFKGDGVVIGYPDGVQPLHELLITTIDNSESSARFAVSVVQNALAPGEHKTVLRFLTGRITAAGDATAIRQVDVPVRITVKNALVVKSPQAPLQFSGNLAKAIFTTHFVNIFAQGINWTVTSSQPWVILDKTSGRGDGSIRIGIDNVGLPAGESSAVISIRDMGSGVSRTFDLRVTNRLPAVIQVDSGGELALSGVNGAPAPMGSRVYALDAMQAATWTVRGATSWLKPSISSDPTQPTVAIQTDISGMKSGDYSGSFIVEAVLGGEKIQRVVPVSLRLQAPALQQLSDALDFSEYSSERVQDAIVLALNTGQNFHRLRISASGSAAPALSFPEWVDVSAESSAVPVVLDAAKLVPGNASAVLKIQGQISGEQIYAEVPISVRTAKNRLFVSHQSIGFVSSPDRQRLREEVAIADASELADHGYDVITSAGWLSVEGHLRTGRTLLVKANPAGLAAGFHEATLTMKPSVPGFSGVEIINVGLYVTNTPAAEPLDVVASGSDSPGLVADTFRPYVYMYGHTASHSVLIRRVHIYTGASEIVEEIPSSSLKTLVPSQDGALMFALMMDNQLGRKVIRVYSLPDFKILSTYGGLGEDRLSRTFSYARPSGRPMLLFGDFSVFDLETEELLDVDADEPSYLSCGGSVAGFGAVVSADGHQYVGSFTGCVFRLGYSWIAQKATLHRIYLRSQPNASEGIGLAAMSHSGDRYYFSPQRSSVVKTFELRNLTGWFPPESLPTVDVSLPIYRLGADSAGGLYTVSNSGDRSFLSFFDAKGLLKENQENASVKRSDVLYSGRVESAVHSGDQTRFIWLQPSFNENRDALMQIRAYPE